MKDYIRNSLVFLLGCFVAYCFTGQPQDFFKSHSEEWIDKGGKNEKLPYKEYEQGLMMSDTSVIKTDQPFIDDPILAGKIAVAIFEDKGVSTRLQLNYPFAINKDVYSWFIYGLCDCEGGDTTVIYLDLQKYMFMDRSNGMVSYTN